MVCINALMHIMDERGNSTDRRRRVHSAEFKRALVERSLEPGASVSALALENGLNANLLFAWRRAHLRAAAAAQADANQPMRQVPAVLLPVELTGALTAPISVPAKSPQALARGGTIEVDIGGARIRLRGSVDEASLRCVRALRERP